MNRQPASIKRISRELQDLKKNTSYNYYAGPISDDNLFLWHFTIRGPPDTPFDQGIYHGKINFPSDYPFKPPEILFLNQSGRYETNTQICLSITNYHPESWNTSWTVRTMLQAIISTLPERSPDMIGIGGISHFSDDDIKKFAKVSRSYECKDCGLILDQLQDKPTQADLEQMDEDEKQKNSGKQEEEEEQKLSEEEIQKRKLAREKEQQELQKLKQLLLTGGQKNKQQQKQQEDVPQQQKEIINKEVVIQDEDSKLNDVQENQIQENQNQEDQNQEDQQQIEQISMSYNDQIFQSHNVNILDQLNRLNENFQKLQQGIVGQQQQEDESEQDIEQQLFLMQLNKNMHQISRVFDSVSMQPNSKKIQQEKEQKQERLRKKHGQLQEDIQNVVREMNNYGQLQYIQRLRNVMQIIDVKLIKDNLEDIVEQYRNKDKETRKKIKEIERDFLVDFEGNEVNVKEEQDMQFWVGIKQQKTSYQENVQDKKLQAQQIIQEIKENIIQRNQQKLSENSQENIENNYNDDINSKENNGQEEKIKQQNDSIQLIDDLIQQQEKENNINNDFNSDKLEQDEEELKEQIEKAKKFKELEIQKEQIKQKYILQESKQVSVLKIVVVLLVCLAMYTMFML